MNTKLHALASIGWRPESPANVRIGLERGGRRDANRCDRDGGEDARAPLAVSAKVRSWFASA
jgi:hypothetical protein